MADSVVNESILSFAFCPSVYFPKSRENAAWSWWAESCLMPEWKEWKEMMCHRCTSESQCLMGSLLGACWSSWPYVNIFFFLQLIDPVAVEINSIWHFLSVSFVRLLFRTKICWAKLGSDLYDVNIQSSKGDVSLKILKYLCFQSRCSWEHFRGKYSPSDREQKPHVEDRCSLICT